MEPVDDPKHLPGADGLRISPIAPPLKSSILSNEAIAELITQVLIPNVMRERLLIALQK